MSTRWLIGLVLLIFGAGLLLEQFGVFPFREIVRLWWPVLIVLFGLNQIIRSPSRPWGGAITVLFGVIILAWTLQVAPGNLWALLGATILILIGLRLLAPRRMLRAWFVNSDERIKESVVFWGANKRTESKAFKGGTVSVVLGGAEIDMRGAKLSPQGADMELSAVLGGIRLLVPKDWPIVIMGTPILGGMDMHIENQQFAEPGEPALRVRYSATLGGVDVRN